MISSMAIPIPLVARTIRTCNTSTHSSYSFGTLPLSFSLFKTQNQPNLITVYKTHFQTRFFSQNSSHSHHPSNAAVVKPFILFAFSLGLLSLRLISNILLPDFTQRWHALIAFSSQAEAKLRSEHYPAYLIQAVDAYEDRRFFHHFGVDPVAIARAVVSFSTLGGGSTITQQRESKSTRNQKTEEGKKKWRKAEQTNYNLGSIISTTAGLFLFFPSSLLFMGSFLFFLAFVSLPWPIVFSVPFTEFVYPNFSASFVKYIDHGGTFLFSQNGTFGAAMCNPGAQQTRFYLCIVHSESNTIIWSANRDAPVSASGKMSLTSSGITVTEEDGNLKWSTPSLPLSVSMLQLTEGGNLVLLDQSNATLWESYNCPTDTIVLGQSLCAGTHLSSAVSGDNLSKGDYRLTLTTSDAILQWQNLTYWKLSMETKAFTNSHYAADYMTVNETGLFLFGHNGSIIVIHMNLSPSGFRTAKLDYSGQFIITSFLGANTKQDFVGPSDACRIPYICKRLGLCTNGASPSTPVCSCPSNFIVSSQNPSYCVPSDNSYSLPLSCNSTKDNDHINSSSISYIRLGFGIDYFANDFTMPTRYGIDLSVCQDLCSGDCSCFGIFYENSSGSCYMLENKVGSIILRTPTKNDQLGYIKTLVGPNHGANANLDGHTLGFPLIAVVLLPFTGLCVLIALGFILWRRSRVPRLGKVKSGQSNSPSSGDLGTFSIPGLPIRFEYEELEAATENFKTQIGSGGFGAVYKGTLPDKTLVAVKKINNLGIQGKKDFCTEIAVIGNIHHVDLVKLKGYCAQGSHRLLVYEYMNRGSLDRSLFGCGPVLEWQERVEIALGAARGLAYLHSGCEHKIIHCDIKPENILLHDQFQAKLSDFGLSKLLSPEQSSHFTTMRGTRGYLAPEWLTSSAISEKTDVYSFGMVLLEIVSGRKNCPLRSRSHSLDDSSSVGGHSLSSSAQGLVYFPLFALEMHDQKRYLELADPRLEGRVTSEEVEKFIRVALCCVQEEPSLRPSMVSVIGMLEGEITLCDPRMESLNFLRFYGLRFAEASIIAEARGQNDYVLYPRENTPQASTRSVSNTGFSYISSQQISGPR